MPSILGLDIGGANLKAAHSDGTAVTRSFPLWKSPADLAAQLRALRAALPRHETLAVTMTGELCDCFPTRQAGIHHILDAVVTASDGLPIHIWTTAGRFVDLAGAKAAPLAVAAANWLAAATLAGQLVPAKTALLLDTGSTTTDIVRLENGVPRPRGLTDLARLESSELVYTGVRRTPVCAVLGLEVAAEFFATMQDVYILLGLSPEAPEDTDTADGRPATCAHAHARLARLRCADVETFPRDRAESLARRALLRQVTHVEFAIGNVLKQRRPDCVVLAGSGETLGRAVCHGTILKGVPVVSLRDRLGPALSEAACAYAVARLAEA